jgi:hypothetical protein
MFSAGCDEGVGESIFARMMDDAPGALGHHAVVEKLVADYPGVR